MSTWFDPVADVLDNAVKAANDIFLDHMAKQTAKLLEGSDVQKIHFSFGHVVVTPEGFKAVAKALKSGKIKMKVDAKALGTSIAEYDQFANVMTVRSYDVLNTIEGRGGVVHEAAHAVADWVAKRTAIRSEEGASFVAEAWYYIAQGIASENANGPSGVPFAQSPDQAMFDVATDLIARSATETAPIKMTRAQIASVRRSVASVYRYKAGHYKNNGF